MGLIDKEITMALIDEERALKRLREVIGDEAMRNIETRSTGLSVREQRYLETALKVIGKLLVKIDENKRD